MRSKIPTTIPTVHFCLTKYRRWEELPGRDAAGRSPDTGRRRSAHLPPSMSFCSAFSCSMHRRHTHTSAACAVLPDFWQKCDAIERFVCFCVCRKNPLALRAKMLSRAQFCYLRRSRFSTCCRQVFDTLFNNILYISALQTTMSCGIVHHAAQEAVVATADMHQRRRLSHCTERHARQGPAGKRAGDDHQGERK